jgi:hypothetical protein
MLPRARAGTRRLELTAGSGLCLPAAERRVVSLLSRPQADFENKGFFMADFLKFLSLGTMDVSFGTAAFPRSAFCGVLSYQHFYQNWIPRIAPLIRELTAFTARFFSGPKKLCSAM